MHILPLDPYQRRLLESFSAGHSILATGPECSGKNFALIASVIQNLLSGKNSLIVIDNEDDYQKISTFLNQFQLQEQLLAFNDHQLSHQDLARIKSNIETSIQHNFPEGIEILNSQIKEAEERINNAFTIFIQSKFGEKNLLELTDEYEENYIRFGSEFLSTYLSLKDFEFSHKEYENLCLHIEKCKAIFRKEYLEFEANNLFSAQVFSHEFNEKDFSKIKEQFGQIYADLLKHRNGYIKFFYNIKDKLRKKKEEEYYHLSELRSKIFSKIREMEIISHINGNHSKRSSNITSRTQAQYKNLLANKYDELYTLFVTFKDVLIRFGLFEGYPDLSEEETFPLPLIKDFVQSQDENFKSWNTLLNQYIEDYVKRINMHNAEDLILNNLETKLNIIIENINGKNLLEERFENNALSSFKKFQYLDYMIQQIEFAFFQLQKLPAYFKWKYFWQNLNSKSKTIILNLVKIDKKIWMPSFQSWYFKNWIGHRITEKLPSDIKLFQNHKTIVNDYLNTLEELVNSIWATKRESTFQNLKNEDKSLFNAVFKKNVNLKASWPILLLKYPGLMFNSFPVILATKKDLLNMNAPMAKKWDSVFSYCVHFKNRSELDQINSMANQFVHFQSPQSEVDLNLHINHLKKTSKKIELMGLKIIRSHTTEMLSQLSLRKRLIVAKELASKLVMTGEGIRIFHLKKSNIITLLSGEANKKLINTFEDQGIKESKIKENIATGLVEVFLDTDKPNLIFYQNGLLNLNETSSFYWQRELIAQLRLAGVHNISIWSSDLLQNPETAYKNCFQKIEKIENLDPRKVAV